MWTITAVAFLLVDFVEHLGPTDGKSYSVYSPSCHMLDPDPFDESIVQFVRKMEPTSCTSKPPLTSVSQVGRSHTLHLHKENFHHYNLIGAQTRIKCEYDLTRRFKLLELQHNRDNIDNLYRISSTHHPLERDLTFIDEAEFISVHCFLQELEKTLVYVNVHAFIGFKEEVGMQINLNIKNPPKTRRIGVMIIGFDSMSRSSIRRNMPKTVELLSRMGWYNLNGYNKVEDNTFPNLMAILSGMSFQQLKQTCWPNQYVHLDGCPNIWKTFSERGFITAYAEDQPGVSTFNALKMGLKKPPTDYYLRPFMSAAEKITIKNQTCLGPAKIAHYIFNYSIDFAKCFYNHPTFSLFWINSFSHNNANEPSAMDDDVVSYFKRLEESGILKTTMVIFLSDHGLRVGPIRETYVGHIEDRLPFIYLWLPQWFKTLNPKKMWNLASNANKLTSPYDIHMTLVDILGDNTAAQGCPGCQSLFKPVPWNRSCMDAGITEHWCACNEYKDEWVHQLAETIVEEINYILQKAGTACARLNLKAIHSLRTFGISSKKLYTVTIMTSPGDATFEATAVKEFPAKWRVLDTISRTNSYDHQKACTNDFFLREYCICRDY